IPPDKHGAAASHRCATCEPRTTCGCPPVRCPDHWDRHSRETTAPQPAGQMRARPPRRSRAPRTFVTPYRSRSCGDLEDELSYTVDIGMRCHHRDTLTPRSLMNAMRIQRRARTRDTNAVQHRPTRIAGDLRSKRRSGNVLGPDDTVPLP